MQSRALPLGYGASELGWVPRRGGSVNRGGSAVAVASYPMRFGWIFLAGGAGALLRYALSGIVQGRAGEAFPWGTLAVNVVGCFAIGLLATAFEERSVLSSELRLALLVGLLGGFTTFSTFGLETWRLLEGGEPMAALGNALGSVVACLFAVAAGIQLGRLVT